MIDIKTTTNILSSEFCSTFCLILGLDCRLLLGVGSGVDDTRDGAGEADLRLDPGTVRLVWPGVKVDRAGAGVELVAVVDTVLEGVIEEDTDNCSASTSPPALLPFLRPFLRVCLFLAIFMNL